MANTILRNENQRNVERSDCVCRDQEKLVVMLTLKLKATHYIQNTHIKVIVKHAPKVQLRENRLRSHLSQGKAVATKKVYFVALPAVEAHSGHEVG